MSQYVEFNSVPNVNFKNIALETIDNFTEIISPNSEWQSGYNGLIQIISLKMISEILKNKKI